MGLSQYWKKYADGYVNEPAHWYQPKGLTIKRENLQLIKKRLRILKKYRGENWGNAQKKYMGDLVNANLVELKKKKKSYHPKDYSALARMNKVIFDTLGLAWVDPHHTVFITPFGERYLARSNRDLPDLVENQLLKFQLRNPTLSSIDKQVCLFPHCFLLELLTWTDYRITDVEYILFVSRACKPSDLPLVVEQIDRWRRLDEKDQHALIETLKVPVIKKGRIQLQGRRTSLYNTIKLNAPYVFSLHTVPRYMEKGKRGSETFVKIKDNFRSYVANVVHKHQSESWFVDYENELDWISVYGDPQRRGTVRDALEYYEDRHRVAEASEALLAGRRRGVIKTKIEPDEYTDRRVREKLLEIYLADNLHELEEGLNFKGMQVSTPTGPLDLLAKDKQGQWVVIELKRDRASDKVIGQIQRYIGYIRTEHGLGSRAVRGMIVARKIDNALRMAIKGNIKFPLNLFRHDSRFQANIQRV